MPCLSLRSTTFLPSEPATTEREPPPTTNSSVLVDEPNKSKTRAKMKMRLSKTTILAMEASNHLSANDTSKSTSSGNFEVRKASVVGVKWNEKIRKFCRNGRGDGPRHLFTDSFAAKHLHFVRSWTTSTHRLICHPFSPTLFFLKKLLHTSEMPMAPQHCASLQSPADVEPSTTCCEKLAASDTSSLGEEEDNSTSLNSFSAQPGGMESFICRKNPGERLQRR